MRVIEEFQALFGERFAGAVKNADGLAAGLFVKIASVRNPGATRVLQAQRLAISRNAFDIVPVALIREVHADWFEAPGVEHFLELLWSEIVSAGQFDILDSI